MVDSIDVSLFILQISVSFEWIKRINRSEIRRKETRLLVIMLKAARNKIWEQFKNHYRKRADGDIKLIVKGTGVGTIF